MNKTYVYYSKMPSGVGARRLYPEGRMIEIERCKSGKARAEKYWVWVLLEHALKAAFDMDIANLQFTKMPSGKWVSDSVYFSLSHTEGAIAVAVSETPVGVDIERMRELRSGIEAKILTDSEMADLRALDSARGAEYLILKWCEKEAIFKSKDRDALLPRSIETAEHNTRSTRITIDGEEYMLAVAQDENAECVLNAECRVQN